MVIIMQFTARLNDNDVHVFESLKREFGEKKNNTTLLRLIHDYYRIREAMEEDYRKRCEAEDRILHLEKRIDTIHNTYSKIIDKLECPL